MAARTAPALSPAPAVRLGGLLADVTPLRVSPAYRRLWGGLALSNVGQQMAVLALSLQMYAITGSTASVGLLGLAGLVPLVLLGLYGGSLVDSHDRRTVAFVSALVLWSVSLLTATQAWLQLNSPALLYVLVAIQAAGFAVNNPARQAIIPRLLPPEHLPAANALGTLAFTVSLSAGPFLAGLLVGWGGYRTVYSIDAVLYLAALYAVRALPAMPPVGRVARAGFRSVLEGLTFLRTRPNVRATFVVDLTAMVLSQPRALFPAVAAIVIGGGATTVGLLGSATAVGSVLAGLLSGRLGGVRRQGAVVMVCVALWGAAISGFGLVVLAAGRAVDGSQARLPWLLAACGCLAVAGAADTVSSVFRNTILQDATPDGLRGRLQGVFVVVVAGGPRLGDAVAGGGGQLFGEGAAAAVGGLACIAGALWLALASPNFRHYDARHPHP